TEKRVFSGHGTLALENLDLDVSLVVSSSREDLALLRGDSRARGNALGHDATKSLDTEGKRSNIKEEEASGFSGEDTTLHRGTNSSSFVAVDSLEGLTVEEVHDGLAHLGHACIATNQHYLRDLALVEAGVLEALLRRANGALDEIAYELLELR